jgi:predicted Fe-Mo cluster-binding NifX family protein
MEVEMRLCITSSGEDIESEVDERFGRAPYLLIVDTETMESEAVKNTALAAGHGAGIGAAQIISDKGAEALLTGIVGPNAFEALRAAGIRVYEGASEFESVRAAVERFKKGAFKEVSAPSGGPGMGRRFRGGRW